MLSEILCWFLKNSAKGTYVSIRKLKEFRENDLDHLVQLDLLGSRRTPYGVKGYRLAQWKCKPYIKRIRHAMNA